MNKTSRRFAAVDILLLVLTILPLAVGLVLKILFTPPSEGIQITGALVYFTIPFPVQDIIVSEAQVNSWLVILSVLFLCLYLTHGIRAKVKTKRQTMLEWIVEKSENMVQENMGDYFMGFVPFIAAILALSAFSSLLSLLGMYPPTSDINIVGGWAILVFALITYYKFKCGPLGYIKSFGDPVPFLAPLNIISEVATPILSGTVISVLIATGLQGLTALVLGWLPGWLGEFPFLRIGLPAVLSIYFDVFSGVLQAYIFAMLTMLYVAGGFPAEEFFKRQAKKKSKS